MSRASYKRKDQTEVTVALKVFFDLKKQKPNFLKEMGVTFRMQHCNILKLIGYVQLKDHYGLVLELMENGNLYERKPIDYLSAGCQVKYFNAFEFFISSVT